MGGATGRADTFTARAAEGAAWAAHRTALLRRMALLIAGLLIVATAWAPPARADLGGTIDAILGNAGLDGSGTGVCVWDLDTAELVYERNDDALLTPASNLKLVTGAAALRDWGGGHQLVTELYADDAPVDARGTLRGNLYLRGLGDPSLSTRAYQREEFDFTTASFEAFARSVRRKGIKKVTGRVIGDASWFDRLPTVPGWRKGLQIECGPLSALSGDQGRDNGVRVKQPARWAAGLLTKALVKAGIKVKEPPRSGATPDTGVLIKRQYSARLRTLLRHMNQESDNFFAEMILKGLGKDLYNDGSTKVGATASREMLRTLGIPNTTYVIDDGSGLSYHNRITAHSLVRLLGAMRQRDDFDDYYDSLPAAGKDGTVHDRMRGTAAAGNARAKTGTLNIAACLSGYVESDNGHLVAFAILMNGSGVGSSDWAVATRAQDKIVAALAKATLPGKPLLASAPMLRQHSVTAVEPTHGVGGRLRPAVEP
jgi:D-alanyl-D-alanine carboxypeptidase/D-alanyl-D-alanine-endopeptidase (penicillin-binding protein 4)